MATKRKALGNAKRFRIFQRDGFRCQYCGRTPPVVVLHIDHIVPVSGGGENDDENLVSACSDCNHGKHATPLDPAAVPRDYAILIEDTKQRAAQLRAYRKHLEELRLEVEQAIDMVGNAFWGENLTWRRDEEGTITRQKVERFIGLLGLGLVIDAARIAVGKNLYPRQRFKYFCGVCWNRCTERGIRGREDAE